jgi:hypothetical protein
MLPAALADAFARCRLCAIAIQIYRGAAAGQFTRRAQRATSLGACYCPLSYHFATSWRADRV